MITGPLGGIFFAENKMIFLPLLFLVISLKGVFSKPGIEKSGSMKERVLP